MSTEPFLANKTINEISIKGRTKPYFMGINYEPLILNLSFGFLYPWNDELIREIIQTFNVDYYKPLWFEDGEDHIFYCMTIAEPQLIHNSLKEGYVNLQFKCNDIYTYSRIKNLTYTSFNNIRFSNRGDVAIYPEIIFIKDGGVSIDAIIKNERTGERLIFEELEDQEEIYVDGENQIIMSNYPVTYRYNNHNNVFLKMERGNNILSVEGISSLKFTWQYKTLPG
jgi:phage-related protein